MIATSVFYNKGCVSKEMLIEIISSKLGFTPQSCKIIPDHRDTFQYSEEKVIEYINDSEEIISVEVGDDKKFSGDKFWYWSPHNQTYDSMHFYLAEKQIESTLLKLLLKIEGFNACYIYDKDFVGWENTKSVQQYEIFKFSHVHLKKVWNEAFSCEEIDIKQNAGRWTEFIGMRLMAAPIMYLGKGFFHFIPKEKVSAFPNLREIEELDSGQIRIELFQEIGSSKQVENYNKLRAFREWCQMDTLEEELPNLRTKM